MKSTILLFFTLIVATMSLKAQTPYSKKDILKELNKFNKSIRSFDTLVIDVPSNFNPQSLVDFEEYIPNNTHNTIKKIEIAYFSMINSLKTHNSTNGDDSFQLWANSEINEIENKKLPSCFEIWYRDQLASIVSSLNCHENQNTSDDCIEVGIIESYSILSEQNECLKENYKSDPPK